MSSFINFRPNFGSNQVQAATGTAAALTFTGTDRAWLIQNSGANIGYVRCGPAGTVATTADLPLLSGQGIIIEKAYTDTIVSVISSAGTTFQVIAGNGA